ncbi:hypothetical protein [Bdellovibrio bacteriovorus]|uniref:hypothetical protein n=1 Tax=Bdellovibrio bacteriovorus TaxID=959 RepID=UPI0035A69E8A
MNNMVVNPREAVAFTITIVSLTAGIVLWAIATFQSKEAAGKFERDTKDDQVRLEKRMDAYESEQKAIRTEIGGIRADTSYIRGRLEPKTK